MNELKFNSQICTDINQSKKLLELGLKPETADCMHSYLIKDFRGREVAESDRHYYLSLFNQDEFQAVGLSQYEKIPAWSLHRLIELGGFNVECKGIFWRVTGTYISESCDKIYDTIIDSIEALITEDLFNKEYLKQ